MSDLELDILILENLGDVDATASRAHALGGEIWRSLGRAVETWAEERGWKCEAGDDDIHVYPSEWIGEPSRKTTISLGWGPGDMDEGAPGQPSFWLSRLVGAAGGQLCLWLTRGVGARIWRPAANARADVMADLGFRLDDDGNFYAECTISPSALKEALADEEFTEAFKPVTVALDRMASGVSEMTSFLKAVGQI